jgi:uncharacterized membrane protein
VECLSIFLVVLTTAGWMCAVSYADYMVAQFLRFAKLPSSRMMSRERLSFQILKLPWGYSQWIVSGVIVLVIAFVFAMINFWVLAILAIISTVAISFALYNDAQQIEQINRNLPPPEPLRRPLIPQSLSAGVRLVGISGEHAKRTFEFDAADQEITIGRSQDNMLHLSKDSVSRHHARIACANNQWFIQDLSSTGIYVNGKKVNGGQRIHQRDRIRIGSTEFEFTHR